jgi:hypothetical protein
MNLACLDVMFLVVCSVCSVCISNGRHPRAVIDATDVILPPETLAPAAERHARDERGEAGAAETVLPRPGQGGHRGVLWRESLKWRVEDRGSWMGESEYFFSLFLNTLNNLSAFNKIILRKSHFHPVINLFLKTFPVARD